MYRIDRTFRRNRRGGILVLTAVLIPVVILISALCVDLGMLYLGQGKTEVAAVQAAEAGQRRIADPQEARDLATQVAEAHLLDARFARDYQIDTDVSNGQLTVVVSLEIGTVLARFMNVFTLTAVSSATRPL